MSEVVVTNTLTGRGEPFLIFDNKKKNRILLFCSPNGLHILSKSKTWHGDGTFHCAAKFFAQLYTIHAYFPSNPKGFNKDKPEEVWVKRMLPLIIMLKVITKK